MIILAPYIFLYHVKKKDNELEYDELQMKVVYLNPHCPYPDKDQRPGYVVWEGLERDLIRRLVKLPEALEFIGEFINPSKGVQNGRT